MKAITFQGVQELAFQDVPDPELRDPGDVVVQVEAAGLCGSDLHPYFGREGGLDPGTVMGHEFVGRVVEVGPRVSAFRPGDRVVAPFTTSCGGCFYCERGLTARCTRGELFGWVQDGVGLQGAQAQMVRVPLADGTLVPVPEEMEDPALSLLAGDILSTALFGAELAVHQGDVVVVVGCGPVGLLAIRAALFLGAEAVVAVDRVPSRLELARRFGAAPTRLEDRTGEAGSGHGVAEGGSSGGVEPGEALALLRELTEGRGADAAIEAVGTPEATRVAADLLRPGGTLAAVGVHTEPYLALAPSEIYDRNLTYTAGRCSARHFLPRALELARSEEALLLELITHRLPLHQGVDAYRRFAAREPGWAKVVFTP